MHQVTTAQQGAGGALLHAPSWWPAGEARGSIVLLHGLAEHSGRYP